MTTKELFKQLFHEFAVPIRIVNSLFETGVDVGKSAGFKGSQTLVISICAVNNKGGVGVRFDGKGQQLFLVWIQEAEEGGLEAIPSRKLLDHPDKPLIDTFLARAEELEKELSVPSKQ